MNGRASHKLVSSENIQIAHSAKAQKSRICDTLPSNIQCIQTLGHWKERCRKSWCHWKTYLQMTCENMNINLFFLTVLGYSHCQHMAISPLRRDFVLIYSSPKCFPQLLMLLMSACVLGKIRNGELPFLELPEKKPCSQLIFTAISSLMCDEGVQEQKHAWKL